MHAAGPFLSPSVAESPQIQSLNAYSLQPTTFFLYNDSRCLLCPTMCQIFWEARLHDSSSGCAIFCRNHCLPFSAEHYIHIQGKGDPLLTGELLPSTIEVVYQMCLEVKTIAQMRLTIDVYTSVYQKIVHLNSRKVQEQQFLFLYLFIAKSLSTFSFQRNTHIQNF